MLEHLRLQNVGPAPEMEIAYRRRVNLLTGDNGLGKTFLLDAAWWSLTGHWPHVVNPRLTVGFPAQPGDLDRPATIEARACWDSAPWRLKATWSRANERWTCRRAAGGALVLYAHANGSVFVWDPVRNYPGGQPPAGATAGSRHDNGAVEQRPAYVFSETDIWDGLWGESHGRRVPVCNGLLLDWSGWIKERDTANADAMQAVLNALSPEGGRLRAGPLQRLSVLDSRDIPTLETAHATAVPVLHAAAGVRRACTLAYVLTWAWKEHRLAAGRLGQEAPGCVILLLDEIESHLHPRWQRTILRSLRDLGAALLGSPALQLLATTHSPLVMASAESWFDPAQDAWFDLDLEGARPSAVLRERVYAARGAAGSWLTSEAFDLATDRGSVEAEQAIIHARALLQESEPKLSDVMAAHEALRSALPDVDVFWVRWNAFVERHGGQP